APAASCASQDRRYRRKSPSRTGRRAGKLESHHTSNEIEAGGRGHPWGNHLIIPVRYHKIPILATIPCLERLACSDSATGSFAGLSRWCAIGMVRAMQSALVAEYRRLGRDRSVHQPLAYLRLRSAIRNVIERRTIEPGHALPSERDLARTLGLSRVTVRKAIAGLVEDGILIQRHGAGTFVAERIVKPMSRLTSFTEDLRARGLDARSEFFERDVGEVTPEESMAMNLSPGSQVVRLHRVRYAGDEPIAIERSVVPADLLPDPM